MTEKPESQEIEKCPFCKNTCSIQTVHPPFWLECDDECGYQSEARSEEVVAISAHNAVSRNNAAAPTLLYWLGAFVDYYTQAGIGDAAEQDEDGQFDGDERFNVRHARAAISKATGESG